MHLATSARSICAVWIEGVPQLIVYLSETDLLFYMHAQHRMIEAARQGQDKNDMLLSVMVSQLGHSLHVVMSSSHGNSNQQISFLKLCTDLALCSAEVLCATGGGGLSCVCYMGAMRPRKGL